jgi:hypothetical protein
MPTRVDASIPYKRLNMQLYWVARGTQHHILYACNFFSRYAMCYNKEIFEEMKKVVLYLKKIRNWKLKFKVEPNEPIKASFICDADFAGSSDRKSTIGFVGKLGQ